MAMNTVIMLENSDGTSGLDTKLKGTSGTAFFTDVGIPNEKSDRFLSGITKTWPGNDSFSALFTQAENIREYRVIAVRTAFEKWATGTAYAVGDIIHPTSSATGEPRKDLVFEVQAIAGTGTSDGTTEPTWPDLPGETVVDNAGDNQITWVARQPEAIHLKMVEDGANEAQEEAWLTTVSGSSSIAVPYMRIYDGVPTEWQPLSKDPEDSSLSRLGFLAIADTWEIVVEGR